MTAQVGKRNRRQIITKSQNVSNMGITANIAANKFIGEKDI